MVETLPKSGVDTAPRIYHEDGVTYAFHDYAQFVVVRHADGYMTGRAMTDMEIRQGEHLRRVREMRPAERETLGFAVDLAEHMRSARFWAGVIWMAAILAGVIAVGAILGLGHQAHLINH